MNEQIRMYISKADEEEISKIPDLAIRRFRLLNPQWEIIYYALRPEHRGDGRKLWEAMLKSGYSAPEDLEKRCEILRND